MCVVDGYNAPMHVDQWEKRIHLGALGDRVLRGLSVPRVSRIINLTAIVLFAANLAHWTWRLTVVRHTQDVVVSAPPVAAPGASLDRLLRIHLFGDSQQTRMAAIPLSHLALTVSGLVMGDPGLALIGAPGKPVKPYRVGDTVAEGVVLEAVAPDRAIVRQDGALQSLPLYPLVSAATGGGAVAPLPAAPEAGVPAVANGPAEDASVPVAVSATVLRRMAAAPQKIGQWLKPGPAGGLVVQGGPGNAFAALHLHPGDIIEQIDGRPVNSLGAAMTAYGAAAKAGGISLDVARNGHIKVLRYTLP